MSQLQLRHLLAVMFWSSLRCLRCLGISHADCYTETVLEIKLCIIVAVQSLSPV